MKPMQRINRSTLSVFAISLLVTPLMQACGGDVDRPPMSVPGAETPSATSDSGALVTQRTMTSDSLQVMSARRPVSRILDQVWHRSWRA